jgi:FkbH-like protein
MTFEPVARGDLRQTFSAALARQDVHAASRAARAMLRDGKSRDAKFVSNAVRGAELPGAPKLRVALLSSFSIEFLTDTLTAQAFAEGLRVEIHLAGFDQYRQEILDPGSALYRFAPDVVILAVEGARWAPALYHDYMQVGMNNEARAVDDAQAEIRQLVDAFRRNSRAVLLVHNLVEPRWRALGILDGQVGTGQGDAIARINERLHALARENAGVHVVDVSGLAAQVGLRGWQDQRMALFARQPVASAALNELARLHVRYLRALAGKARKCLVLDLDNTLWGGVVGEQGPLGVALGTEYPGSAFTAFQRAIRDLQKRGVILAIASKNNPPDVDEVFEKNQAMVLRRQDFAVLEVGWNEKHESLARIAKKLNIGLDHLVFVDDNPVECARVEEVLPAVRVICLPEQPELNIDALFADGLFDTLSLSAEDMQRTELYQRREQAEALRSNDVPIEEFYRDLGMSVVLAPVRPASLARAAQMTQKTNQFNTTTIRFSEAEISARMATNDWWIRTVKVADRFGDHGITGLVMARADKDHVDIETFLMSCRVIGRTVETAVLARLAQWAKDSGAPRARGRIIPTPKNVPVRELYGQHGFTRDTADETVWWLDLGGKVPQDPAWLSITEEA